MGKASKKMNKKRNQQNLKAENQQLTELKTKLMQQLHNMTYAEALDTLAELIDKKCYDPEVLYQGAQTYFLMGDYERAAAWVNNTLHYAPNHLESRLLLAKICLLEDRLDDAMALYTYVLQNYPMQLTDAQRSEIKEGADYTWRTDREWLMSNYPMVADLWTEDRRPAEENIYKGEPAAEVMSQVLNQDVSLTEKVRLLNAFAGGYFVSQDFASTQMLLEKALTLDGHNKQTLTNLAMLTKMQGDKDKALQYVAKIAEVDFVLLQKIME